MRTVSSGRRWSTVVLAAILVLPLIAATGASPASHPSSPNDPEFAKSDALGPWDWGMQQVRAVEAWPTTRGAGVTVAVVDSGVDLDHPDLMANLVAGTDFVGCELSDPGPGQRDGCGDGDWGRTEPVSDHGTHVAGTIGAVADNSQGVYGVAPDVALMPVRVIDDEGGTFGEIASGIYWAVDHGADVINMSLGAPAGVQALTITGLIPEVRAAVQYAVSQDVVVVAAAGNEPVPLCGTPSWEPGVLCVIATGAFEQRASYSGGMINEAPLDVVAGPGGDLPFCDPSLMVLSTTPPELGGDCGGAPGYGTKAGTSMATPHVAGVAALLKSLGCTQPTTMEILKSTARQGNTDERGLFTPVYGWGIVDAQAAVAAAQADDRCVAPDGSPPVAADDTGTTTEGTPVTLDLLANDSDPDGDTISLQQVGQASFGTVEPDLNAGTATYTPDDFRTGTDSFTYTITDGAGNTDTGTVRITVEAVQRPPITIETPADGAVVEAGSVPVEGTLTRPATGGILHLAGDGGDHDTVQDGAVAGTPPFVLTSAGNGGQATSFTTAGSWNLQSWDNPFVPSFAGDEPVTLSGQPVSLTVAVEFNYPQQGALCPVGAQLFTAVEGEGFAPNGAEARVTPPNSTGAPVPVTFTFEPDAGAYDAVGVQFSGVGVDCGTIPARWLWGSDTADGVLTLHDADLLVNGDRSVGDGVVEIAVDGATVDTLPAVLDGAAGTYTSDVELVPGTRTITATWLDAAGEVVGTATSTVTVEDGGPVCEKERPGQAGRGNGDKDGHGNCPRDGGDDGAVEADADGTVISAVTRALVAEYLRLAALA